MSYDWISEDLNSRTERAYKYLATMDASIQGLRGNDKLFTAATALAHGFDLPETTATQMLLSEFNPRCMPPWSEAEIRRAVSDAVKKSHDKPRGHLAKTGQKKNTQSWPQMTKERGPKINLQSILNSSNTGNAPMNFEQKMVGYIDNFASDFQSDAKIANVFGVPAESLRTLGCLGMTPGVSKTDTGEDIFTGTLYWPEEDGNGNTIGIAYRNCKENRKLVLTGSKRGVTLPPGWDNRPGPLLVTEGFSDLIALHAAGLNAVARPSKSLSAMTVAGYLANALAGTEHQEIIILADKDDATETGNAASLAKALREKFPTNSVCWATVPDDAKDPREWITTHFEANQPWEERGEAFLAGIGRHDEPFTGQEEVSFAMPEPIPLGKLIQSHPKLRPVIIGDLLREGETMNVIAAPKTGKSWLVCDLALAIASGRDWLGKFETRKGKVLVLDNELHCETSADRFPKVAESRNIFLGECENQIEIANLRGSLRPLVEMDDFFSKIEPGKFQIIILDAMYRFQSANDSENDNAAMTQLYNTIDRYALRLKCGFVLVHHSSKGNQGEKSVVDVGSGAGSQSRAADTHLVLREHAEPKCVVLDACNRSFAPIEPVGLRFSFPIWNVDDSLDPSQLKMPPRRGGSGTLAKEKPVAVIDDDRPEWDSEYLGKQVAAAGPNGIGRETLIDLVVKGSQVSSGKAQKMIRKACEPGIQTIKNLQKGKNSPSIYVATRWLESTSTASLLFGEPGKNDPPKDAVQNPDDPSPEQTPPFEEPSDNVIPETLKPNKE